MEHKQNKYKHKWSFSKIVVIWAIIMMTGTTIASFVFSFMDKNPITEVTTVAITTFFGCIFGYLIKTAYEKNSRNKYHIDKEGIPWDHNNNNNNNGGKTNG